MLWCVIPEHFKQNSDNGNSDGAYRTVAQTDIMKLYDKHSVIAVASQEIVNLIKIPDRVRMKPSRLIPNLFCATE